MLIYIYRCMCIFSCTCNFKIEMWSFILVFLALLIRDVLFSHLVLHFYTYAYSNVLFSMKHCNPSEMELKPCRIFDRSKIKRKSSLIYLSDCSLPSQLGSGHFIEKKNNTEV